VLGCEFATDRGCPCLRVGRAYLWCQIMPLDENEIGHFLLRRRYATSCALQMTLKAAALVTVVASGAVKFRTARVGSLGKGNMVLVSYLLVAQW
jgi:hypothetical protein